MEKFNDRIPVSEYGGRLEFVYSKGQDNGARTVSTSHGGFDNDPCTMNDILQTITGNPLRPFRREDLDY